MHTTTHRTFSALRVEPSQINVISQQKQTAAKIERSLYCIYKVIDDLWLQLWLRVNCCKKTGYYSIFQLSLLWLLINNQYNCNNTITSVSVGPSFVVVLLDLLLWITFISETILVTLNYM